MKKNLNFHLYLSLKIHKEPLKLLKYFKKTNLINKEYNKLIESLSLNTHSIKYLKNNQHLIKWKYLSDNKNAYEIIKDNLDKIDWGILPYNRDINVLNILKDNQDKIYYGYLSMNPSIYEINKEYLTKRIQPLKKELIEYIYSPHILKRREYFTIKN